MELKIGELAKRCNLSIRTLHHYDSIGLLSPTQRTTGGARIYGSQDLARLHRILVLKEIGYHNAEEAEDGKVALGMLKASKFDFVVSDINMPNMNGFELLSAIKADDSLKHLPVLMVTAEARKEDIVRAAKDGAAGYIVKPFTKATLEEKVQKIMQKLATPA